MSRIGIGQDSHAFDKNKKLVLGGVSLEGPGMKANSDGDVVMHALCNALASAVGKGSLSTYADKMYKEGITESKEYVKVALDFVKEAGFKVNNVSVSIEARIPKIDPHVKEMKRCIAGLLGIEEDDVGITATSGEGLTEFGRGKGIRCFAAVSLN